MPILYRVPNVAGSNSYRQKGPTCWYYAMKILMKFHRVRENPGRNRQWKALHQIRREISELYKDRDYLEDGYENLDWIKKRLISAKNQINGLFADIHKWQVTYKETYSRFAQHEVLKHKTILRRTLSMSEEKAARLVGEIDDALLFLKKLKTASSRMVFVEAVGLDLLIEKRVGKKKVTREGLENLLRQHGPFYAAGSLFTGRSNLTDLGESHGDNSLVRVNVLEEGCHAVVVCGIDGDSLYYKDPNLCTEVRIIDFDMFVDGWADDKNSCRLTYIKCPQWSKKTGLGGCAHGFENLIVSIEEVAELEEPPTLAPVIQPTQQSGAPLMLTYPGYGM